MATHSELVQFIQKHGCHVTSSPNTWPIIFNGNGLILGHVLAELGCSVKEVDGHHYEVRSS
jgi:hypothetical protein